MNILKHKSKIKMRLGKWIKFISAFTPICLILFPQTVFADSIQNSVVAKGTIKLLNDLTTWLLILAPVLTTCVVIYFFIRKAASDEQDQRKWDNRIKVAFVCCILAVTISAVLKTLLSYYQ